MPPWMPAPGEFAFVGERRLGADAIATIRKWVDSGAVEGDRADLPAPPESVEGWQLGEPDLVVTLPRPFRLHPGGDDRYRQVVFPLSLPTGRYVRAVEFRPGSAPVHHAVIRVDPTHASRRRDGADGEAGFEGVMAPDVRNPDGHFVGWTPGQGPIVAPQGMPWRLDRGTDLVVEMHLIPGAATIAVQPTLGLFFTDQSPTQSPVELTMGVKTIDIPAGDRAYRVTDSYVFPVDVTLLTLYPHAHTLGKTIEVRATLPDGTIRQLLHIPQWQFHWQQEYRFVTPVSLPRGTTLAIDYTYDNSAENPANPSSPPRRVTYGLRSSDEMANLGFQLLPRTPEAGRLLTKAFLERDARASVAGAELRARLEPRNAERQIDLGISLVTAGRPADAIAPLQTALQLDASSATAHDYLGRALFATGRPDEAIAHLRQAVTLVPNDEILQIDLGKALADSGRVADALAAFQRATAINPDHSQAHEGLGVTFVRLRRYGDAIKAFERALAVSPRSANAENGLAVALAQAGRPGEAAIHFRRALDLDPDNVSARENLARLQRGR